MLTTQNKTNIAVCFHCGDDCRDEEVHYDEKVFCCQGCKLVYDIIKENNLGTYYDYNKFPGVSQKKNNTAERFAFLDDKTIREKLINFTDGKITTISFHIPQIHCSSCIWLLEHLNKVNKGVIRSQVNFLKREASLVFNEELITLRQLVEMLATIGYEPLVKLDDLEGKKQTPVNRTRIYKIGIAGFCFGNIMLFSFPEYFSLSHNMESGFKGVFSILNFGLSLPVFFYCSSQFFVSAWQSIKQKYLNIDVPIALGILVMFLRSCFEIFTKTGAGYMDTMSGLVFFMLIGRMFQDKTYATLSFDRDYKSFFPIAVMSKRNGKETSIPLSQLKTGERIVIRNEELIPADGLLIKGNANIDYSFVTGESIPLEKNTGDLIYAGGKQKGTAIELEVVKIPSQSYLTQLWNDDAYRKKEENNTFQLLVNRISHYFTIVIIAIALLSLSFWMFYHDFSRGMNAFTAVLIIACPCALAISSPFTLGNILRVFGRMKFYLKNFSVIEKLAKIDVIVFDKTGTLTKTNSSVVEYYGEELNEDELKMIRSLIHHSSHPLSRMIFNSIKDYGLAEVIEYKEISGKGITGFVFDIPVKIGSSKYLKIDNNDSDLSTSKVYVSIDNKIKGYFNVRNTYREGLDEIISNLKKNKYQLIVLSGDNEAERNYLQKIFGENVEIHFNQSPSDKLKFVQHLQKQNLKVLMIGDGLNDAGALKQSDVGISISDDINNFSPACDGILDAANFSKITSILKISKASSKIISGSFIIALLYNIVGLSFAIQGTLSPVIAAILMPVSSVTIILFTTVISNSIASLQISSKSKT